MRPLSFFLTKKKGRIKLINESEGGLTLLTEPRAQIAFFTLMASLIIWQWRGRGGHTERIAQWTEGEIGVDDANQSYYPCTYSGRSSLLPEGTKKWASDRLRFDITEWGVFGECITSVLSWNINMDVSSHPA